MYRCNNCDEIFDEPESERIDLESYYGVGSLFPDHHYGYLSVCPYCNSEDFDEYDEDDECEYDE